MVVFYFLCCFCCFIVDSEHDIGLETAASLTFESDLILGQDLDFTDPENDGKSIGLDRYTGE